MNPAGVLPNSFFTFKSSNRRVLKVNQKGVVTSLREGKARITVQSKNIKAEKDILADGERQQQSELY